MGLLYSNYECNPVTNNSLRINAVSGTLTKTYKDSYFVRFEKGSAMENFYFNDEGSKRIVKSSSNYFTDYDTTYNGKYYQLTPIIVLQIMLCADDNYLVEAIDKKDYDKMFSNPNCKTEEVLND